MFRCPACQREFSLSPGGDIPYRCPHCGQWLLGPYRIVERVGGGGMGDVYRALDPEMYNRVVAIKVPRAEIANDRAQRRFEREIAASARLEHENIVRAYRRGIELGRPYLVMEFVTGLKLIDVIGREKPLATRRVGRILLGIARGLEHAEAGGVVNRDIKPENVFLAGPEETPKILDYGLALIQDVEEQVTRHGSVLGTPSYTAPEQFRDPHTVTILADVYSLGCTAHSCLTGRPPFAGADLEETYRLHDEAPRPSVRERRPDVPEDFDALVRAMMDPKARDRPGPKHVIHALERLLPGLCDEPPRESAERGVAWIEARCPECGQTFRLAASLGGSPVRCPNKVCGAVWVPPGDGSPGPAPTEELPVDLGSVPVLSARPACRSGPDVPEVLDAVPLADEGAPPPEVLDAVVLPEPAEATVPIDQLPGYDDGLATAGASVAQPAEEPSDADVIFVPPESIVSGPTAAYQPSAGAPPIEVLAAKAAEAAAETPPVTAAGTVVAPSATPAPAKPKKPRKSKKPRKPKPQLTPEQLRARRARRIGAAVIAGTLGLAGLIAWLAWPAPPPDPWLEIMTLVDEHKWDRAARRIEKFEDDRPDDPRVAKVPFFKDLCEAGPDVYRAEGNAERALELLAKIFKNHRDDADYKEHFEHLRKAAVRLVERLAEAAETGLSPAAIGRARDALALLRSVVQAMGGVAADGGAGAGAVSEAEKPPPDAAPPPAAPAFPVAESPETLEKRLDEAQRRVEQGLAARRVDNLVKEAEDPAKDLDAIYRELSPAFAKSKGWPAADPRVEADPEYQKLLRRIYDQEPKRVEYVRDPPDEETVATQPAADIGRQGNTLVVAWGKPEKPAPPGAEGQGEEHKIVLALARGILYVFTKEGDLLWSRRLGIDSSRLPQWLPRTDRTPPALVAISSEDNSLLSLETARDAGGQVRWRYRVGQSIVAPLSIAPLRPDPNKPPRHVGLLPTADGEIHVLETVLGRRLGRFKVGQPMTRGGAYDPVTGLAYFAADMRRIFAIDPGVIEASGAACRSVLLTDHAGGALRGDPVVVGPYLVCSETSKLEDTRLRVFLLSNPSGFASPRAQPNEVRVVRGWSWFAPHVTPDRLTLVTDSGDLGVFGLNLDNSAEALYAIVENKSELFRMPTRESARPLVVNVEEHLVWLMAGGRLHKLSIDVIRQEVRNLWQKLGPSDGAAGIPAHEPQVDRRGQTLFLTTVSPSGLVYRFTAVDSETGRRRWQRQLGVDPVGDPLVWSDHVVLFDRSGQKLAIKPATTFATRDRPKMLQVGEAAPLPEGADETRLTRLGEPPGPVHLVVPIGDGSTLAVRTLRDPAAWLGEWVKTSLEDNRLCGRPCVAGKHLYVPCAAKGTDEVAVKRIALEAAAGEPAVKPFRPELRRAVARESADVYPLGPDAVLLVVERQRLCRLEVQTREGVVGLNQVGEEFFLSHPLAGRPQIAADQVLVLDESGKLYRLDPRNLNRELAPAAATGLKPAGGPFLRGDSLIVVDPQQRLVCFPAGPDDKPASAHPDDPDAAAKPPAPAVGLKPRWISGDPKRGRIRGEPVLDGDVLLVADNSRHVAAIRLADGKTVWNEPLRVNVGPAAAAIPYGPGKVLVPLADGTLLVLTPPRAESPETTPQAKVPAEAKEPPQAPSPKEAVP